MGNLDTPSRRNLVRPHIRTEIQVVGCPHSWATANDSSTIQGKKAVYKANVRGWRLKRNNTLGTDAMWGLEADFPEAPYEVGSMDSKASTMEGQRSMGANIPYERCKAQETCRRSAAGPASQQCRGHGDRVQLKSCVTRQE